MKNKTWLFLLFVSLYLFITEGCKEKVAPVQPPIEQKTSTYTNHQISANGGIYTIDENFVLTVPAGAVPSDTTISVAKLEKQTMQTVFANYGVADFPVVAGFDLQPAGLTFAKPITFTFKSLTHTAPYVPITHTVNLSDNTHSIDSSITIVDNINDSLCISVVRSGSYVVEALTNWPGGLAKYSTIAGCKEGVIKVEASDKDVQCTFQNCQILESMVKVQFLSCSGQPVESAVMREKVGDCAAVMTLTPGATAIDRNSSTSIHALLKIGCEGVKTQTITMTVAGPATISPASIETDEGGKAPSTLSSRDESGTATVTANATVRYAVREIIINGNVENAFYRTEEIDARTSVKIKDLPTWHVDLELNLKSTPIGDCSVAFINYSTHIEFDLKIDTIDGDSCMVEFPGTQSANMQLGNCDCFELTSFNNPSEINFRIGAFIKNKNINFIVTSPDFELASWDFDCYTDVIDWWWPIHIQFILVGTIENAIPFSFPIDQYSYEESGTAINIGICMPVIISGPYTLTVTKKEAP